MPVLFTIAGTTVDIKNAYTKFIFKKINIIIKLVELDSAIQFAATVQTEK